MLGNPSMMRLPNIVGVKLKGSLQKGVTGTDLVLAMTNFLRDEGVIGAYLEFFGQGANSLSVGDRFHFQHDARIWGNGCHALH